LGEGFFEGILLSKQTAVKPSDTESNEAKMDVERDQKAAAIHQTTDHN
jgi:hypothetical protein